MEATLIEPALAWLRSELGIELAPGGCELISGGRSNLTYRLRLRSGARWILRRPPTGQLLPRAHDMAREYRVLQALAQDGRVPVPAPVALCVDETVLSVPFYVMEDIAGVVLRDPSDAEGLSGPVRTAASASAVDALALLHQLDPASVGLGDLGPPRDYVGRQLGRWRKQVEASADPALAARVADIEERLRRSTPRDAAVALVHGDYRFDNLVVDPCTGAVRAVLDWEIATIGDPLADLGSAVVYWGEVGDERAALGVPAPTSVGGFFRRADVVERYAAVSGRDLGGLRYYVAFGYWKLACVLHGVAERYRAGGGGGAAPPRPDLPDHLGWLLDRAIDELNDYEQELADHA